MSGQVNFSYSFTSVSRVCLNCEETLTGNRCRRRCRFVKEFLSHHIVWLVGGASDCLSKRLFNRLIQIQAPTFLYRLAAKGILLTNSFKLFNCNRIKIAATRI